MANKDRQQRRAKRMARQKKRRAHVSRPARDGGGATAPSFKEGLGWPPGDCFVTAGWDAPGATCQAVFTRTHEDGRTVAAFVEVDRKGPGIVSSRVVGVPDPQMVLAECIRRSQAADDLAFQGAPPSLVAGLLLDAEEHGERRPADPWGRVREMLEGVEPEALDTPFGADPAPPRKEGLLDRLFRFLG